MNEENAALNCGLLYVMLSRLSYYNARTTGISRRSLEWRAVPTSGLSIRRASRSTLPQRRRCRGSARLGSLCSVPCKRRAASNYGCFFLVLLRVQDRNVRTMGSSQHSMEGRIISRRTFTTTARHGSVRVWEVWVVRHEPEECPPNRCFFS